VFEGFTAADNMTRLLSGVISGTVFLNGDDLTRPAAQALARAYLTNPRLNAVARLGKSFRPLEGNTGPKPVDVFVMQDGAATYLAVFNFGSGQVTRTVDLARAGLQANKTYAVTDLWSNATSTATGTLSVPLDPTFSKLFKLE
jgi:alpha-galactosidase